MYVFTCFYKSKKYVLMLFICKLMFLTFMICAFKDLEPDSSTHQEQ